MLDGIERTIGALAVRQPRPLGQWVFGLANQLETRLAETNLEPRFRSVSELESVFNRADQVLFARHRAYSVVAPGGKVMKTLHQKKPGGLPGYRGAHDRILQGRQSTGLSILRSLRCLLSAFPGGRRAKDAN